MEAGFEKALRERCRLVQHIGLFDRFLDGTSW
jgi:hypothetical protein